MSLRIPAVQPVFVQPVGPTATQGSGGGGGSGILLSVSAPALQVPASAGGTVSDFSLAVGQAFMFNGQANVNAQTTFSITVQNNCTAAITTGGAYSFSALSQNVGSIVIQGTYLGVNYSATVSISKQIPGATGSTGPAGATGATGPTGPGGVSGLTLVLSNPAATVLAFANGNVPTFAGISGKATVLSGGTDVTASSVLSAVAANLTGTINNAVNTPVNGQPMGYYQVTAMSASVGTLTITAQYLGTNVTQVFNVSQVPTGYQIVSSLPSSGPALFQGNVVFLTTDNKLYRYTGSAWVSVVPATDVTGQLTAAQIASINAAQVAGQLTAAQIASIASTQITGQLTNVQIQSLDASQLTGFIQAAQIAVGSITANQIASGTIVAGNIAAGAITTPAISAGAVTAAQIAAGTIVAGNIAAGAITGTQIAASTITSSNIQTNAITANQISAGAVTAAKIGVSSLSAISATLGAITAGTISALSGQAFIDMNNGYIEWNNGVFMKVSGVGFGAGSNYIEWYGPTQSSASNFSACTDALGVYWIKTDGSSFFGGQLHNSILRTYTNASGTETVPAGYSNCMIELSGGSGPGGHGAGSFQVGGGGGAGGYCKTIVPISAGDQFSYTAGAIGDTSQIVALSIITTMTAGGGSIGGDATTGSPGTGGNGGAAGGGNLANVPGFPGNTGGSGGRGALGTYHQGSDGGGGGVGSGSIGKGLGNPGQATFYYF